MRHRYFEKLADRNLGTDNEKTSIVRRNPLSVIDTNSASVENTLTISLGNNKLTIHPTPVIKVDTIIDNRKVANTRS